MPVRSDLSLYLCLSLSLSHTAASSILSALINCLMGLVVAIWEPRCQPVPASRAGFWWLASISPSQACVVETGVNNCDSLGASQINTLLYKLSLSPAGTRLPSVDSASRCLTHLHILGYVGFQSLRSLGEQIGTWCLFQKRHAKHKHGNHEVFQGRTHLFLHWSGQSHDLNPTDVVFHCWTPKSFRRVQVKTLVSHILIHNTCSGKSTDILLMHTITIHPKIQYCCKTVLLIDFQHSHRDFKGLATTI